MAAKTKKIVIRNNGGGARRLGRGDAPDMGNMFAGIVGGGLGALAGGLLVRWDVNPTLAAVVMTVGGGVAAYTMDGKARAAAAGLAAAGAGQLALAMLANRDKKDDAKVADAERKPANAALPPGSLESAYEQAQARLAQLEDDDARYANAIDIEDYEERAG